MELKESLVIVESPAKAKTINKILGKNVAVKASVGHIMDLPKKELGVDTENGFTPKYTVIPGKEKVIKELREAAAKVSNVYLAPDPDREGEAIAWHISEIISEHAKKAKKKSAPEIFRITFNEITERAVKEAVQNPSAIDKNRVYAQQARRVLDRLVGYKLSPLLWRKVSKGLSAGRVQSVAVRLIVDREREIEAFKEEEYWSVEALFEGSLPPQFKARLFKYNDSTVIERSAKGNKFLITSEREAKKVEDDIKDQSYILKSIEKKAKRRSPSPPFITSTLQQESSKKYRFSAKKTMMLAQQLYEGIEIGDKGSVGLITYMRTDSTRLAPEAVAWARNFIENAYGKEYVPKNPPKYKVKASAQEAHEAVRPTYEEYEPSAIKKFLSADQFKLYSLIWKRFTASQMSPAKMKQTIFEIHDSRGKAIFRATGTIIEFKGFLALYSEEDSNDTGDDAAILPPIKEGESVNLMDLKPEQHFTQPPPRYTEATLVKTLEEKGIGRPSTYAAIISTIVDRKYVLKEESRFKPSELGVVVNDLLVKGFPELIDLKFTAKMEGELDKIEEGELMWDKVIDDFYPTFNEEIEKFLKTPGKMKPEDIPTDINCEQCNKPMVVRWGRHGRFFACSGFPECKNTKPLENDNGSGKSEPQVEKTDELCGKCGSPMVIKQGRFGRFISCSNYPECKTTKSFTTGVKCPEDNGDIAEKRSKKGRLFYGCSNYPECKFAIWYKPIAEKCPGCGNSFILEKKNKSGVTVFCNNKECGFKESRGND